MHAFANGGAARRCGSWSCSIMSHGRRGRGSWPAYLTFAGPASSLPCRVGSKIPPDQLAAQFKARGFGVCHRDAVTRNAALIIPRSNVTCSITWSEPQSVSDAEGGLSAHLTCHELWTT